MGGGGGGGGWAGRKYAKLPFLPYILSHSSEERITKFRGRVNSVVPTKILFTPLPPNPVFLTLSPFPEGMLFVFKLWKINAFSNALHH